MKWESKMKFNPASLEEIVIEYLKTNGKKMGLTQTDRIKKVEFGVAKVSQGYGLQEYDTFNFSGCTVTIERES